MNVLILGCGRTGATLALQLAALDHKVTVIDRNPDSIRRLGSKASHITVVVGNGLDLDTLEKAGVQTCDAFFALTRGDNTNLMAAQIVQRKYPKARVSVKVADPQRAEAYKELGLFCINASALLAGMCKDWLMGEDYKTVDTYNKLIKELEY